MDEQSLRAILQQVYRKFPEYKGIQPKVKRQAETSGYVLTFQHTATARDGTALPSVLRVTVNEQGKILKTSTSR